jgi:alpha/beta superfamily hydrolase
MEIPSFFTDASGSRLYSMLHLPDGGARGHGFVFCPPSFGERTKSYRVPVTFARLLARQGFAVCRFDYRGEGDSDGDFEDATLETRIADIAAAAEFLAARTGVRHVHLFGLRLGATLAAMAAQRTGAASLILWAPVMDVGDYLYECLRKNLSNQLLVHRKIVHTREQLLQKIVAGEKVNVDGWYVTKEMWEQGTGITLAGLMEGVTVPTLIVDASDTGEQTAALQRIVHAGDGRTLASVPREFSWSDWKQYNPQPQRLFEATLQWIASRMVIHGRSNHVLQCS